MPEDLGPSAGKIRVKITCPLFPIADLEADSVEIPAINGRRLMMPKTAPVFCLLKAGDVLIHTESEKTVIYHISSGVCEMRRGICAMMTWGVKRHEVDREQTEKLLKEAESALVNFGKGEARREIQDRISFYRLILKK